MNYQEYNEKRESINKKIRATKEKLQKLEAQRKALIEANLRLEERRIYADIMRFALHLQSK